MEDEMVESLCPCPVCLRHVTGCFATHLQLHSKQDLILAIINQQESVGLSKVAQPHGSGHSSPAERTRRSSSPSKKGRVSRRKDPKSSPSGNTRTRSGSGNTPPPLIPISDLRSSANHPQESLILELDLGQFGNNEAETTEVMPIQVCSYISDPGSEGLPNEPNTQLQMLYPMDQPSNVLSTSSHSNFIRYIIEGQPNAGNDDNQHLAEWILPDGRSIPVYSTLAPLVAPPEIDEDPLSLDNDISICQGENDKFLNAVSLSQHSDFDLMTDEEIPPRGEISEFEESNTSSHQSDELNKPGIMHIGSSLGSLFTSIRHLSPVPMVQPDRPKEKLGGTRIEVISVNAPSSGAADLSDENRHKCPEANCSQVGSILELAHHQEKVHQQKYKVVKKEKTLSSQISVGQGTGGLGGGTFNLDRKPLLTSSGKVKKEQVRKSSSSALQCPHCAFYSDNFKLLHAHLKEAHPGEPLKAREHECTTCGKIFHKKVNLKKHVLIHGVKKFRCDCGKAFTSGFKLMEHNRVHTKNYPFQCSHCKRHYRTPSLLKSHMARAHPIPGVTAPVVPKKLEFFCAICARVLRSKRSYTKHLELHNETTQKCPICYETFPRNAILTRHIRIAHDSSYETKESTDCPVCLKKMHPNSMKSHMRIHDNVKPFQCPICSKSFRTSANLASHSWSHTNAEKPYKCTLCPKSYLFKKCLEAHLIVHKKRRFHFVCNECGMKFTSKVNLKRHCQEHFSEKKYKCNLCSKRFHRKYYLVEHERVHSGTKPFNCTICGKLSTTRSNHRAHTKIHDARDSGTQEG